MNIDLINRAYENLANAVVVQAAADYRLGKEYGDDKSTNFKKERVRNYRTAAVFLKNKKAFSLFSATDPAYIVEKIDREVKAGNIVKRRRGVSE